MMGIDVDDIESLQGQILVECNKQKNKEGVQISIGTLIHGRVPNDVDLDVKWPHFDSNLRVPPHIAPNLAYWWNGNKWYSFALGDPPVVEYVLQSTPPAKYETGDMDTLCHEHELTEIQVAKMCAYQSNEVGRLTLINVGVILLHYLLCADHYDM